MPLGFSGVRGNTPHSNGYSRSLLWTRRYRGEKGEEEKTAQKIRQKTRREGVIGHVNMRTEGKRRKKKREKKTEEHEQE